MCLNSLKLVRVNFFCKIHKNSVKVSKSVLCVQAHIILCILQSSSLQLDVHNRQYLQPFMKHYVQWSHFKRGLCTGRYDSNYDHLNSRDCYPHPHPNRPYHPLRDKSGYVLLLCWTEENLGRCTAILHRSELRFGNHRQPGRGYVFSDLHKDQLQW